jgi:hypothetical protein
MKLYVFLGVVALGFTSLGVGVMGAYAQHQENEKLLENLRQEQKQLKDLREKLVDALVDRGCSYSVREEGVRYRCIDDRRSTFVSAEDVEYLRIKLSEFKVCGSCAKGEVCTQVDAPAFTPDALGSMHYRTVGFVCTPEIEDPPAASGALSFSPHDSVVMTSFTDVGYHSADGTLKMCTVRNDDLKKRMERLCED